MLVVIPDSVMFCRKQGDKDVIISDIVFLYSGNGQTDGSVCNPCMLKGKCILRSHVIFDI